MFAAISRRHRPGVEPTIALNVRLNAAWSEKPQSRAISDSADVAVASLSFAMSILMRIR